MTTPQMDTYNSFLKTQDFNTEKAAVLAAIAQLPLLHAQFNTVIDNISIEAALGSNDNTGAREDKSVKRLALEAIMLHVSAGLVAHYTSINDLLNKNIYDFGTSEISKMRGAQLHMKAEQLHIAALAKVGNLIGVSAADVTALQAADQAFFEAIDNPERVIDKGIIHNNNIPPLLDEGRKLRNDMDIYMRTFRFSQPDLYEEFQLSLSIDDTGSATPPSLTNEGTLSAGETITIDYSAVTMQGNSDIKLINESEGKLIYGFSSDGVSFVNSAEVNANSNKRLSAASLGYDAMTANILIVSNPNAASCAYKLLVYDMD
jgi:hypothetical protein